MTPDYFGSSVYTNTVYPSSAIVIPPNDIGRFENRVGMSSGHRNTKRFTTIAVVSLFFNLLLIAAITWASTSYFFNRNRILGAMKSADSLRLQNLPCGVDLSSAMCMSCEHADPELLWKGTIVKIRTGTKTLCCRKVEESLITLSKEMRDVRIFQRKQTLVPNIFHNIDVENIGGDFGRLPLIDGHPNSKVKINETGMYKLFVAITAISNETVCRNSNENFIRVVLEYPVHNTTTLMHKNWKCLESTSGLNYLLPLDLSDTFQLPKGGDVYVVVEKRNQIYPYKKSNHFGLMKI